MAYKIKTVADLTGIPKNTLIAWERRYGLPRPARTDSGYRVYSDDDLALLQRIKALLDAGYRISEAIDRLVEERQPKAPTAPGMEGLRTALLDALLAYDTARAEQLSTALVTVPFGRALDEVYLPLLQEVGMRWETGDASIAQEHLVSGWCRERILSMTRSLEPGAPDAPEAICATPAGERHEFGLLGVAFHLARGGYRVLYLGADVPLTELVRVIRTREPAIVALSAVLERPGFDLVAYAHAVRDALPPTGRVLLGGRATGTLAVPPDPRVLVGPHAHAAVRG